MTKSSSERATLLRIAGLCGIMSPIISFTLLALSIHYAPWFNWRGYFLSDLGMQGDRAAMLFKGGLITGGILSAAFAIGLMRSSLLPSSPLGRLGALALILASCAVAAIGILPKTMNNPHTFAAGTFFTLAPFSLLLIGAAMTASSEKALGLLTFIMGVLTFAIALVPWPWVGSAISQALLVAPLSAWSVVLGTRLLVKPA